jgi:acyl-coenzyme A thioesterase PaaI-like protein
VAVTAELSVKFKKPVRIGVPAFLEGRVVSESGRLIETEAVLRDAAGTELASGTGKLIKIRPPQASGDGRRT